jgi:DNA-binding NarL/FixJ family response regulator
MSQTVVIAEDHGIVRDGLVSLLSGGEQFRVVAAVEDGLAAIAAVQEHAPDVLVLDVSMPRLNGLEAVEEAKRVQPGLKTVVLTVHAEEEYVLAALRAGADGYLLKDGSHAELQLAIESVLKGHVYLSPQVSQHLVGRYLESTDREAADAPHFTLSTRERMVLKLIAEGYKNREIGEILSISPKTVEKHRASVMKKLDVHNVSGLVSYALTHGIANAPDAT